MNRLAYATVLALGSLLTACGGGSPGEDASGGPAEEVVFVGQLVDYTGPTAFVGEPVADRRAVRSDQVGDRTHQRLRALGVDHADEDSLRRGSAR